MDTSIVRRTEGVLPAATTRGFEHLSLNISLPPSLIEPMESTRIALVAGPQPKQSPSASGRSPTEKLLHCHIGHRQ
jgi:hypothetical protein